MKFKQTIGIDVGKSTLAVHLHLSNTARSFKNTDSGITQLLTWVDRNSGVAKDQCLYVVDQTGLYAYRLALALSQGDFSFVMASGLVVKNSSGIIRGKSDPIDAKALASYGYLWQEKLELYQMPSKVIIELKNLLKLRERMVKQRAGYKSSLKEQQKILKLDDHDLLVTSQSKLIDDLSQQIKAIEKRCRALIKSDKKLTELYRWITSIKGVGPQTAWHFIALTDGFKRFKGWRSFACYCGTAPFPYQSGSSIRGKTRVSHMANKQMKKLLNMCALSASRHDAELKGYYQKKIDQGKHKMSVINAVRNKIIARVFAVVKRQSNYVNTCKFAA